MGHASIQYIGKNYESNRREQLAKIYQFINRWTDLNHHDLGLVLLELFWRISDMFFYCIDDHVVETFLSNASRGRTSWSGAGWMSPVAPWKAFCQFLVSHRWRSPCKPPQKSGRVGDLKAVMTPFRRVSVKLVIKDQGGGLHDYLNFSWKKPANILSNGRSPCL